MGIGRAGAKKVDDGFTTRTVMAMATEMAEAHKALTTACVQFSALALTLGIAVDFEQLIK